MNKTALVVVCVSVQVRAYGALEAEGVPIGELLAVSKRWLTAREAGFFTDEMKARLRDTSVRHSLVEDGRGGYLLKELPR